MKPVLTHSILFISLILLFGCNRRFGNSSVIYEGVGVDKFALKNLETENVKTRLDSDYVLITHNDYSGELLYKKYGVSFYYLLSEPKNIFAISFKNNYEGKTSRGFEIEKMTVGDLVRIYGSPRWNRLEDTIYAHYDSLGIYFQINPIDKEPHEFRSYNTNDSFLLKKLDNYYRRVYKNEKVAEISIGIPGTSF